MSWSHYVQTYPSYKVVEDLHGTKLKPFVLHKKIDVSTYLPARCFCCQLN